MANDGTVKIGAEVDSKEFSSGLSKLGHIAKTALAGATAAIGAVTAATTAVGGAVVKATSDLAAYGDNIDKMSQKMGMSAEAYQEWDAVMQHSGTSIESMQASMKTLASAAETGNEAFEKLGISQYQLSTMSQEELFGATITALQNVESETERTYLAGQLLGRGATELGALLNTSAEDTQKMKDRVHELGGVMSDEAVKAAAQYQDSLQDMQTAFSGLSRNMVSDFLPAVTQVMDGLTEIFAGNGDSGIEMISQGISDFASNLSETIPEIVEMGGEILGALLSAIIDNLPQLIDAGTQAIVSLVSGIVGAIPGLVSAAGDIISTLVSSLASAIPELATSGADVIRQLAQGFEQGLPELAAKIPEIIASAIDFLTEHLPEIMAFGVEIINSLVNGIISAIPALLESLPQLIDSIANFFIEYAPLMLEAGVSVIKNLIDGITAAIPDLVAALPDIINSIVDFIVEALPQIISTGAQLILALIGGIVSAIPDLVAALPQIVVAIVQGFAQLLGSFVKIGADIVAGILEGILGAAADLIKGIGDFFSWIIDGVKDLLGIHSPSTVFAEIGKNMILGLGEGWNSESGSVEDDIAGAMDDLSGTLSGDVQKYVEIGHAIADGILQGIQEAWDNLVKFVTDGIDNLLGSVSGFLGLGGGVNGKSSLKSGGSSPRRAAPAALSDGGDDAGLSTYSLGPSRAAASLETAMPDARARVISDLAAAVPAAQSRVAIATADMAPTAAYSAPPPASYGGNSGNGQPVQIIDRRPIIIKAEGDLAPLAQLFKPVMDAENARVGVGVQ